MPLYPPLFGSAGEMAGPQFGSTAVRGSPVETQSADAMRERAVTFTQFQGSEVGRIAPGWSTATPSAMPDQLAPLRTREAANALMGPAYGYYTATQAVKPANPMMREDAMMRGEYMATPLDTRGRYRQEAQAKRGVSSQMPPGSELTAHDLVVVGGIAALLLIVLFAVMAPR